jgi:hypothetical protein
VSPAELRRVLSGLGPTSSKASPPDGQRTFSIECFRIVTQDGAATTDDYGRHCFAYAVPPGEAGADTRVTMLLLNEETVRLSAGAAPEIWHRRDVTG